MQNHSMKIMTEVRDFSFFLPRDIMRVVRSVLLCGVCPSVCLSVTFLYYIETNKCILNLFHLVVIQPF